jgi:hypothetical protein
MTTTPAAEPRQDRLSDKIGRFVAIPHTFIKDMRNLPQCAIVLFVYLRSCANKDTGDAFPAYGTIAKETGLAEPTISKAIKALVGRGWITKKRRFSNSTIYELCDPSITKKNEVMDAEKDPPLLQNFKCITSKNEVPLLQKMKPNKTKAMRIKEQQQQQAPQVEVAAAADFSFSEFENTILSELKTHGITRNKKTSEIVKRFAGCEHALDIIRSEAKKIASDRQNRAGVLISVLSDFDIATYTPPVKTVPPLIEEY